MNILASSENNQSFYSIADFSVRFITLSERNVSLQEETSNVPSRRIGVKWFHFRILMMCQSICCWSHKLTLYLVAVDHAFSRRKITRVAAHTLIYVSQCEMRHSNPVLQHWFISSPFPVLSLFVRHSCFACLPALSVTLSYVQLHFFVACFLDLFLSPFLCFPCL